MKQDLDQDIGFCNNCKKKSKDKNQDPKLEENAKVKNETRIILNKEINHQKRKRKFEKIDFFPRV